MNFAAAGWALEFLFEPVVDAVCVEQVATLEQLHLHSRFQLIKANAAHFFVFVRLRFLLCGGCFRLGAFEAEAGDCIDHVPNLLFAQKRLALFVELVRILEALTGLVLLGLLLVVRVTSVVLLVVGTLSMLLELLHRNLLAVEGDVDASSVQALDPAEVELGINSELRKHLLDV